MNNIKEIPSIWIRILFLSFVLVDDSPNKLILFEISKQRKFLEVYSIHFEMTTQGEDYIDEHSPLALGSRKNLPTLDDGEDLPIPEGVGR